jgi:hypothetical protein
MMAAREGFSFSDRDKQKSLHFFGEAPERRPWAIKREDAPGRFCRALPNALLARDTRFAYIRKYPIPPPELTANSVSY